MPEQSEIPPRKASLQRKTSETEVTVELNLDGTGKSEIKTNIKFLSHMLDLLARHSQIDIKIDASGDLKHHIVEDVGILLGQALKQALGDKRGITRYGYAYIPMDEVLARCAIDLGGRAFLVSNMGLTQKEIEDIPTTLLDHFLNTLVKNSNVNLHLEVLYGTDEHHKVEACFKALARALKQALALESITSGTIPSTKGIL
ncbi:MAG: imidazoleglycerol-phosphate dehydratase HisB [Candidatus Helarchaeota archaeon]|nr:imidazoleglycerol-phosphate dehydratase HisB [Candidatus Helarchaeota archaeon]